MHQCPLLFGVKTASAAKRFKIAPADVANYEKALIQDAKNYFSQAIVTAGSAVHGIKARDYSWSTVKFYYSVFYACRAILAINRYCFLSLSSGQTLLIEIKPGSAFVDCNSANTHKVVLEQFAKAFLSSILVANTIDGISAFKWMQQRRVETNYTFGKFQEPAAGTHFKFVDDVGIRSAINDYISDQSAIYAFDPDHAVCAFPILTLKNALQSFKIRGEALLFEDDLHGHLKKLLSDRTGYIAAMAELMRAG